MEKLIILLKAGLLFGFCFLNAMDLIQTMSFIKLGIESNPIAVYYPNLWFPFKFLFTFGFPVVLYGLDTYSEGREDGGFHHFVRSLVILLYFTVLIADIFFLSLMLRNTSILRRFV